MIFLRIGSYGVYGTIKATVSVTLSDTLMWSITHFPSAMRSLNPTTRAKAIEIANQLVEQGQYDTHTVIATSIDEARLWARLERSKTEWPTINIRPYA